MPLDRPRCCAAPSRLGLRWHADRYVDLLLRTGPRGDRFLPWRRGLNLQRARGRRRTASTSARSSRASRGASCTATGRVHLAAAPICCAPGRARRRLDTPATGYELSADRPARAAHQQLVDAQRAGAGRRPRALRAATCIPRTRRAPASRDGDGRGAREPRPPRTGARAASPTTMRARRRQPAARLGPRGERAVAARRRRATRACRSTTGPTIRMVESVVGQSILNGVPVRLRPAAAPGG